jgi:hypothetical protein
LAKRLLEIEQSKRLLVMLNKISGEFDIQEVSSMFAIAYQALENKQTEAVDLSRAQDSDQVFLR